MRRHRELTYPHSCQFGGLDLVIDRNVFCPTLTNTSALLLAQIDEPRNAVVLDVFAGSGAFGIWSALHGAARVVCLDTSRSATACAQANAARNRVGDRVDVRRGSIVGGLHGHERFDVVIANPPLLPGRVTDELSAALFDPGLAATLELLEVLTGRLAAGGTGYLLTSDVLDRCGLDLDALASDGGLAAHVVAVKDVGYETYRVHRLQASDGAA